MRTSLAWDQRRGGRATVEARKHRRRRWRLQPSLLALEDRRLLSTFTVNSTGDTGTGSGLVGDLRYCITQANAAGGPETITFDKTVFQTPQTITGTFELSDTTGTETILGPVAGVTISGGGNGNVFQVNRGVTATLSGLTITDANGSGVANYGTEMTLTNCTISGNYAAGQGGGVANAANNGTAILTNCTISGNYSQVYGGGVSNNGTVMLANCTISGNSAFKGGGVDNGGTAIVTNCTISGNKLHQAGGGGDPPFGGGVYNGGTATLTDTIVAGNTGLSSAASDIYGTVTGYSIYNLIGTGGSGGLNNGQNGNIILPSLTRLGLAPLAFYGGPTRTMALLPGSAALGAGVIAVYPGTTTPITTDQRGEPLDTPNPDIGAFQFHSSYSLVVKTTSDSTAPAGEFNLRGAIDLANILTGAQTITFDPTVFATAQTIGLTAGPLVLSQTSGLETINGSHAGVTISGGGTSGVFQVFGDAALSGLTITDGNSNGTDGELSYSGGGVFNSGTVTLTNCTLSGDSARIGGGVFNSGKATLTNCTLSGDSASAGGGLQNDGTAILGNCTLSGNSAVYGGGVYNYGKATFTNCTISGNSSSGSGGGVYNYGTARLTDTIVAGNTGPSSAASDIIGMVSGSYNLIGTGGSGGLSNGQNGNIVLTSLTGLGLAPLAFYGGPTQTMALLPGSAALGAGVIADYPGTTTPITTDQRGEPLDTPNPDIGAFQFHSSYSLVVKTTSDSTAPAGEFNLQAPSIWPIS